MNPEELLRDADKRAMLAQLLGGALAGVRQGPLWLAADRALVAREEARVLAVEGFLAGAPDGPAPLRALLERLGSSEEQPAWDGHFAFAYAEPRSLALSLARKRSPAASGEDGAQPPARIVASERSGRTAKRTAPSGSGVALGDGAADGEGTAAGESCGVGIPPVPTAGPQATRNVDATRERVRRADMRTSAHPGRAERFARAVEWPIAILALAVVPALIMENRATTPAVATAAVMVNWVVWLGFCAE
jgi:hypothetical protein